MNDASVWVHAAVKIGWVLEISRILDYFKYNHLPLELQEVSRPFRLLAEEMVRRAPKSPETLAGLRKLLEAKDCAVRAALQVAR